MSAQPGSSLRTTNNSSLNTLHDQGPTSTPEIDENRCALRRHGHKYVSSDQTRLRNDLMVIVGYLEFFNALDFPANIWNDVPVRPFAKGLMITGGSLALIASTFAIADFRRSLRNVKLLRQERNELYRMLNATDDQESPHKQCQAWLSLNYRELGWELIDRALMDVLVGFGAVLVGIGTIMAIGGANRAIYNTSNLLSGYIGNGFVAVYGIINAAWSAYLYIRAKRHKRLVRQSLTDPKLCVRAVKVFRSHQIYAITNAVTLLVSSAGSLITAKKWWGYILLIPCIVSSVFCNIYWRRKVGYSRMLVQFRSDSMVAFDHQMALEEVCRFQSLAQSKQLHSEIREMTSNQLQYFITQNEMMGDLRLKIANRQCYKLGSRNMTFDSTRLESMDRSVLLSAMDSILDKVVHQRLVDRERMLCELYGAFLHQTKSLRQTDQGMELPSPSKSKANPASKIESDVATSGNVTPRQEDSAV